MDHAPSGLAFRGSIPAHGCLWTTPEREHQSPHADPRTDGSGAATGERRTGGAPGWCGCQPRGWGGWAGDSRHHRAGRGLHHRGHAADRGPRRGQSRCAPGRICGIRANRAVRYRTCRIDPRPRCGTPGQYLARCRDCRCHHRPAQPGAIEDVEQACRSDRSCGRSVRLDRGGGRSGIGRGFTRAIQRCAESSRLAVPVRSRGLNSDRGDGPLHAVQRDTGQWCLRLVSRAHGRIRWIVLHAASRLGTHKCRLRMQYPCCWPAATDPFMGCKTRITTRRTCPC